MSSPPPLTPNPDDFSAATKLITFPQPLPLLRGPIRAGPADDPSSGPYLLAFGNPRSWAAAYTSCKANVISQCGAGSRIGCSISASHKCKPPWWRWLLGSSTSQDLTERAKCEEIEMEACLVASKERCSVFAKQKCVPAFKSARIQASVVDLKTVEWKQVFRLMSGVPFVNRIDNGIGAGKCEATTIRGCDLLNCNDEDIEDYLRKIVDGKQFGWNEKESSKLSSRLESDHAEFDWVELEADLYHWSKSLRPVQWYPGHIAKTEKELKEQLKLMDVVIEVRDARIPISTSHPQMDSWLGNRKRIVVLNREDMISTDDRNAWANYYSRQGIKIIFANGKLGMGAMKLNRLAKALASGVNVKRREKGLLPRRVRAGIVGYPNVGKSSLINRLLKRRMCTAAARPGVTRELKWVRFGEDLELLDSPGMIPMRINDQSAAIKLAICDDIGERSYDVSEVAAILVQMLARLPTVGYKALRDRYKIEADGHVGRIFVQKLALQLFNGDSHQAAFRILTDFRKGKFGWFALERPPKL